MEETYTAKEMFLGFIIALPVIFIVTLLMSPLVLLDAWATWLMYLWFLVPLGLPMLNVWHMLGITILIYHFKTPVDYSKKDKSAKVGALLGHILGILFMLLIGFILKGLIK